MDNKSEKLIRDLKLDEGRVNFSRKFNFKVLPFFTRNPERAKFKNGFNPILGAMARSSLDLKKEYGLDDYDIDEVVESVESIDKLEQEEKQKFLYSIFDYSHLDSFNHPHLINYYTLSEGNESKGEIAIAEFMVDFFNLRQNEEWKSFIRNKESNNLVEKMLIDSIRSIEIEDKKNNHYKIITNRFEDRFEDLKFLLKNKDFALKYMSLFFAFYYFQYIIQASLILDRIKEERNDDKVYPLFFTLENERITGTRQTNKQGFNLVKETKDFTLINDNLLGYINTLLDEKVLSFNEIIDLEEEEKNILNRNLGIVLNKYKEVTKKNEVIPNDFLNSLELFKKWLSEDVTKETRGRYYSSIEEIGNLYFLKRRGSLGKILTLRKDMIILLTAIVVKDKKMIISEVFKNFESRGVFLDRYSKEAVVALYERMGILDKKSDSGEAKYVKPIL